jgi:hypothetical protein
MVSKHMVETDDRGVLDETGCHGYSAESGRTSWQSLVRFAYRTS